MEKTRAVLGLSDVLQAHERIRPLITRTPVMTSETLDEAAGGQLYFKCENFQKVGAFKARGAANAVFSLSDESVARGVVTHSSGNHAAALARAARLRGVPAYIVMPDDAPKAKIASVKRYGGDITFCPPTLEARESSAREVIARTGAAFVHPYDDPHVMAGQGTVAVEILEQVPHLDVILCPVGGGGLLAGLAVAAKALKPSLRIIAVEPAAADDAARSFAAGHIIPSTNPNTIADGLLTSLGDLTFAEIRRHVDEIITVPEAGIVTAMRTVWEVMKIIIEPSAAVPFAAVQAGIVKPDGLNIGIVLTGGNLDFDRLPWQGR